MRSLRSGLKLKTSELHGFTGFASYFISDFLKIHHLQLADIEIGLKTGLLKAALGETDQDEESPLSLVYIVFINVITTITIIMVLGPQGTHGIPS